MKILEWIKCRILFQCTPRFAYKVADDDLDVDVYVCKNCHQWVDADINRR